MLSFTRAASDALASSYKLVMAFAFARRSVHSDVKMSLIVCALRLVRRLWTVTPYAPFRHALLSSRGPFYRISQLGDAVMSIRHSTVDIVGGLAYFRMTSSGRSTVQFVSAKPGHSMLG